MLIIHVCFIFLYRGHKVQTCIVVRHLSPDDEIIVQDDVSGDDDQEPPAKRPYNKFKVKHFLAKL